MSEEELKRKIDEFLGMESRRDGEALLYESPTGVLLFELYTLHHTGGWRVGGHSTVLPNAGWNTILRMERSK